MSNIKKFRVEHTPTYAEIVVEIDLDHVNKIKTDKGEEDYPVSEAIKDMVDFWTGSDNRLRDNDGNYLNTFLKQLATKVIGLLADGNFSTYGIIEEMKDQEGWCKLDGSFGIKLLDVTSPEMDTQTDYEIMEES